MSDFPKPTVKRQGITWTVNSKRLRTCTHNGVKFVASRSHRDGTWYVTPEAAPFTQPVSCHDTANLSLCVLQLLERGGKVAPPAKA